MKRDLESVAQNQQQRVGYYESRANYRTMAYLAWLRFFYFALSSTSSTTLHCVQWPMVLGLSLSSSLLLLLNVLEALIMLYRTHKRLHMICQDHATVCRQMGELNKERALNDDSLSGGEMKVYVCAMAFALLAVTAFELDACKYVICN